MLKVYTKVTGDEGAYRVRWATDISSDMFPVGTPQVNLAKRHNRYSLDRGGCWFMLDNLEGHTDHAGRHPTMQHANDYIAEVLSEVRAVVGAYNLALVVPGDERVVEDAGWSLALSI